LTMHTQKLICTCARTPCHDVTWRRCRSTRVQINACADHVGGR
jgi:hypothetical protein